jgi:hypothetical protein
MAIKREIQMSDADNQDPSDDPNEVSNDEEYLIFGTHTERLINWVKANPAPGLSPQESQMLALILLWLTHAPRDLLLLTLALKHLTAALDITANEFKDDKNKSLLVLELPISLDDILLICNHLTNNRDNLVMSGAFNLGPYNNRRISTQLSK